MAKISASYESLLKVDKELEQGQSNLMNIKLESLSVKSKSKTMEDFKKLADDVVALVEQYQSLLLHDTQALFDVCESFEEADKKEAQKYLKSIQKLRTCPVEKNGGTEKK